MILIPSESAMSAICKVNSQMHIINQPLPVGIVMLNQVGLEETEMCPHRCCILRTTHSHCCAQDSQVLTS